MAIENLLPGNNDLSSPEEDVIARSPEDDSQPEVRSWSLKITFTLLLTSC